MGMNALGFVVVNPTSVAFAAILAFGGLVLVAMGWFDVLPRIADDEKRSFRPSASVQTVLIRIVAAIAGLILGWLFTGWPAFAFYCGVGGAALPTLTGAKRARRAEIEKVDAMATWIESVRDNIAGSAGLQQALRQSGANAPSQIRGEVRDMTLRLQHESVQNALRKFAADLANPASDLVVACLVLATTRSAGSLGTVLAQTAQAARDSASMMRQIEAGRASSLSQAKLTGGIAAFVMVYMILFKRDFVGAYDTFVGQSVLFGILTIVAGTVFMLHRMSKPNTPVRVFAPEEDIAAQQVVASAAPPLAPPAPEGVA